MPRTCTVCTHQARNAIDAALVAGVSTYELAAKYRVSDDALQRHRAAHLPKAMTKAHDAKAVANADDLLAHVKKLEAKAIALLLAAEKAGDFRTAISGVREARGCIELLAKLMGELSDAPTVNITINPQWLQVRAVVVQTLEPFPEARQAVAAALAQLEPMETSNP
jgi:hypothetical protein